MDTLGKTFANLKNKLDPTGTRSSPTSDQTNRYPQYPRLDDGYYKCYVCRDQGLIYWSGPDPKTDYGEWVKYINTPVGRRLTVCDCQKSSAAVRNQRFAYAELTQVQRSLTFGSFLARPDLSGDQQRELVEVQNACQWFAHDNLDEEWLTIFGSKGWGKTHLVCAIANVRIDEPETGHAAKFVEVPALLQKLRSGFDDGTYDARLRELQEAPLLILDDLGAERGTPWSVEQMFLIINHRYNRGLPIVATSNVTPNEIDSRIRDRVMDQGSGLCRVYNAQIPSYRSAKVVN